MPAGSIIWPSVTRWWARYDKARGAYLEAKEQDLCPLRIVQPMNEAVLDIAEESSVPLIDADRLISERSTHRIPGGDWLIDHVHPTIEGHQLLADALADLIVARHVPEPQAAWRQTAHTRYREHFDALSPHYFQKGTQQLESLRKWAQGRATRLRGKTPDQTTATGDEAQSAPGETTFVDRTTSALEWKRRSSSVSRDAIGDRNEHHV